MVDAKEDKLSTPPAPDTSVAAVAGAPEKNTEDKKVAAKGSFTASRTMSKGESFFEWATYSGLNFWVNLGMSVIIADYFKNRGGKKTLEKATHNIAGMFSGGASGPTAQALNNSKKTLEYAALTSGGWILLVPLKLLEDAKRPIVHWLNEKMGVSQTATDGSELTPDQIYIEKEQPKMPWWKVFARRVLASSSVLVAGNTLNYTLGTENITNFVMKGVDGKGGVNKVLNAGYVPGGKFLANNTYSQSYMRETVLDSLFTKLTAFVMWATNGAKKKQMPKEVDPCATETAVTAAPTEESITIKDRSDLKTKKPQQAASFVEAAQQKPAAGLAVAP